MARPGNRSNRPRRTSVVALAALAMLWASTTGCGTSSESSGTTGEEGRGSETLGEEVASDGQPGGDNGPEYDFVFGAQTATLNPGPDGSGHHTLELSGADASAIAFSDRPQEIASPVDPQALFALLGVPPRGGSTSADPPNAALVADNGPTVVMALLDATSDRDTGNWSLSVELLEHQGAPASFNTTGETVAPPVELGPSSLFIDATSAAESVHVVLSNNFDQALTVETAEVSSGQWASGMQPVPGEMVEQYQTATWGIQGSWGESLGASVMLTQPGHEPMVIQMSMAADGQTQVESSAVNSRVEPVTILDGGQAVYEVTVSPTGD